MSISPSINKKMISDFIWNRPLRLKQTNFMGPQSCHIPRQFYAIWQYFKQCIDLYIFLSGEDILSPSQLIKCFTIVAFKYSCLNEIYVPNGSTTHPYSSVNVLYWTTRYKVYCAPERSICIKFNRRYHYSHLGGYNWEKSKTFELMHF